MDARDHPFILGATNPKLRGRSLASLLDEGMARGKPAADLRVAEDDWRAVAGLKTFSECVADAIKAMKGVGEAEKLRRLNEWNNSTSSSACQLLSNEEAREIAASTLGLNDLFWDWDLPRTREGFYRFKGSVDAAIVRGRAFGPYADLVWMETCSPDLAECTKFADGMKLIKYFDDDDDQTMMMMLAYNLSPSFNWDASGMSDEEMREFIPRIGRLGFCWQFITLAGFHADALVTDTFAKDYANRGMLAYVERIQREERNNGVDTLAHQKWSGANYYDRLLTTVQGGITSTAAMGKGVTEEQFKLDTWSSSRRRPDQSPSDVYHGSNIVLAKSRM